jgi:hypothetical protein
MNYDCGCDENGRRLPMTAEAGGFDSEGNALPAADTEEDE